MNRRRKMVAIVGIAIAVAAVAVLAVRFQPEPTYAGQPASHWLDELVTSQGASSEAKSAFRALGEQAVPYLIEELTKRSEIREKLAKDSSWLSYHVLKVAPVGMLNRVDWQRRQFAALALGEIGPVATAAVPALVEAINAEEPVENDPSTSTFYRRARFYPARLQAVIALGKIGVDSESVVLALIKALEQTHRWRAGGTNSVAGSAADAFASLKPVFVRHIPAILATVRSREDRQNSGKFMNIFLKKLGPYAPGSAETIPVLIETLADPDAELRRAAARELGTLRSDARPKAGQAIPALLKSLNDSDSEVRIIAAESIWSIDRKRAKILVPALIELLQDPDCLIRLRAVDVLRQIGPQAVEAVPALRKCRSAEANIVRLWFQEALNQIQCPQ